MKIDVLFNKQKELDKYIERSKEVDTDVFPEKCLALIVELSELANEVRSFKYWSIKKQSEKSVLLDEYVDILHFLLSIGNEKKFNDMEKWPRSLSNESLTKDFLETNIAITRFINEPKEDNYKKIWEWMDVLRAKLNFTYDDIERAYIQKNEINFTRQKNGY